MAEATVPETPKDRLYRLTREIERHISFTPPGEVIDVDWCLDMIGDMQITLAEEQVRQKEALDGQ